MVLETTWVKTQMKKSILQIKIKINLIRKRKNERKERKENLDGRKMKQPYTSVSNKTNRHDLIEDEDKNDDKYKDDDKDKDKDEDDLPVNELVKWRQSQNLPDGITQKDLLQIKLNTELENQRQEAELL